MGEDSAILISDSFDSRNNAGDFDDFVPRLNVNDDFDVFSLIFSVLGRVIKENFEIDAWDYLFFVGETYTEILEDNCRIESSGFVFGFSEDWRESFMLELRARSGDIGSLGLE